MSIINFSLLNNEKEKLVADFNKKRPFHYVVIDNFLDETYAENLLKDFDDTSEWTDYCHYNEKKLALIDRKKYSKTTLEVFEALKSPVFINFLQNLTKINNLLTDELEEEGANLTEVREGGFQIFILTFKATQLKKTGKEN